MVIAACGRSFYEGSRLCLTGASFAKNFGEIHSRVLFFFLASALYPCLLDRSGSSRKYIQPGRLYSGRTVVVLRRGVEWVRNRNALARSRSELERWTPREDDIMTGYCSRIVAN